MKRAHVLASGASTPADTHAAIEYAIGRLQALCDEHAEFIRPQPAGSQGAPAPVPPRVSLVRGRLGYIAIPGIVATPGSAAASRFASLALAKISSLQSRSRPCGWIVDLRGDTGGDMYPMLLGIGPIIGAGRLIGFAYKDGRRVNVSYARSALTVEGGGFRQQAPVKVPDFQPRPPIAALTDFTTKSSGEAVAVVLRGRAASRSFGSATAGAPTDSARHRLSDGAVLSFADAYDVDLRGRIYKGQIEPDVHVPGVGPQVVAKASDWLLSTPSCRRR